MCFFDTNCKGTRSLNSSGNYFHNLTSQLFTFRANIWHGTAKGSNEFFFKANNAYWITSSPLFYHRNIWAIKKTTIKRRKTIFFHPYKATQFPTWPNLSEYTKSTKYISIVYIYLWEIIYHNLAVEFSHSFVEK